MRRRDFIKVIAGLVAAWPFAAGAAEPTGLRHIALLMAQSKDNAEAEAWLAALREGLEKLGWSEDRNIHFEFRWAGSDMELMQRQAIELLALQPDLIFTSSSPIIGALLRLTQTIPIVFPNIVDPVGQGFAVSLSRPGRNATGLVNLEPSMAGKWIELLKEVMPRVARVVIVYNPASSPYAGLYLNYFKSTAAHLGVEVITAPIASMSEFQTIAATQAREQNTGFVLLPSAFMSGYAREIGALMAQHQLPAVSYARDFAISGGLLAYGNDIADNYRRAAKFIDRILKGEKPADIPIEFPVKFSLFINLKTAQALGLVVPTHLQQLAEEVFE